MSDVIIGKVNRGTFRFPIEFELFGEEQVISDAVFDTGCSHSFISAKSLVTGDKSLDELKEEALYDAHVQLSIGKGIESNDIDTTELKRQIKIINTIKQHVLKNNIDLNLSKTLITNQIQIETLTSILNSKLIRFGYTVKGYTINGLCIGDIDIKVSFHTGQTNLIGMHIIKELSTTIRAIGDEVYLYAIKNTGDECAQ